MAGFNRVILIGNLTRDPDYRQLASGQAVCRLGLATNRQFKNKQTGTMVQEVCFVDVDVWGAQADSCNQYLQKGAAVLIEGRLKFDTWQDNDGQKRNKHSIVADRVTFLSSAMSAQSDDFSSDKVENGNGAKPKNSQTSRAAAPQQGPQTGAAQPVQNGQNNNMQANPTSSGEVAFKDKPPFEDDLPF